MKEIIFTVIITIASLMTPSTSAISLQKITVTVTVMKPACIINDGQAIEVKFPDNLFTTRIDGISNKVLIDYRATNCALRGLKLMVAGTPTSFDSDLLATNNPNLGIRLLNNASAQALNSWKNFMGGAKPTLEAVLVKNKRKF